MLVVPFHPHHVRHHTEGLPSSGTHWGPVGQQWAPIPRRRDSPGRHMITASDATENHLLTALPDAATHRWLPLREAVDPPLALVLFPDLVAV